MDNQVSKYDRLRGSLEKVCLASRPSTVREVEQITGKASTYLIECLKHDELGTFAFVEMVDESGVTRLALPPKVVSALNIQQEALTTKARSMAARSNPTLSAISGLTETS